MMLTLALLAIAAGPTDGKTMATDDWHTLAIVGVSTDAATGQVYLKVKSTGDLDGDGLPDDAIVRGRCAAGSLIDIHYTVVSPRDVASGQASGKRTHKPIRIVKEWDATTPQLTAVKPTYNVKNFKGNERTADGWSPIELTNIDGVCAPAGGVATLKSPIKPPPAVTAR